ncbi:MAG: hypothetical protein EZS28_037062 [Streblomastix strix]|uniref:Uncharacterized protein n=1 Tax=Streblomastix strix TaxID=222440 RepID=A0A5J4UBW3_9EUKA|nr:MAG: hypothetical protein EZS28_037062 [Streblomastix strix]
MERKQNEQPESESKPFPNIIASALRFLYDQIEMNKSIKSMIKIPKLLQSLSALVTFRLGTHIDLDVDNQRLKVRSRSRDCLSQIQHYGDEQIQTEIVNQEYGRVMSIVISTAGGKGEEQDYEIENGLLRISEFLTKLHNGRNQYWYPQLQPLPLLARRTEEQIEVEGSNEEIEAQMINKREGYYFIMNYADDAKAATLNHFIHSN